MLRTSGRISATAQAAAQGLTLTPLAIRDGSLGVCAACGVALPPGADAVIVREALPEGGAGAVRATLCGWLCALPWLRHAEAQAGEAATVPTTVTRPEAASALGVSVTTVDRLLRTGRLGSVQIGRRVVIRREAIADYLGLEERRRVRGLRSRKGAVPQTVLTDDDAVYVALRPRQWAAVRRRVEHQGTTRDVQRVARINAERDIDAEARGARVREAVAAEAPMQRRRRRLLWAEDTLRALGQGEGRVTA